MFRQAVTIITNISKQETIRIGILFVLLVIYLAPLLKFQTQLAGIPSDPPAHAAQTKWFCDHFFKSEFYTDQYFAPTGVNLANSYDMPFMQTIACLVYPLGPVAMLNFIAVLQIILIFFTSYIVGRTYIKNEWLSWAFVFLFGFSSFVISHKDQHINILSTVWGTALTYWLFDRVDLSKRKQVISAFFLLSVVFMSAWQNIANLTFLVVILLVMKILQAGIDYRKILINLVFGMAAFLPLSVYFSLPALRSNVDAVYEFHHQPTRHSDLLSYIIPLWRNPASRSLPQSWYASLDFEQITPLDPMIVVLLGLILIRGIYQRKNKVPVMILIASIYLLLSYGQYISFAGTDLLYLPLFKPLSKIPPLLFTRVPARLSVVVIFLVTLYVLKVIDGWLRKKPVYYNKFYKLILVYAVINTIILNRNFSYTTYDFDSTLPKQGLGIMSRDTRDVYILHLPTRVDQTQNFLQLYHGKKLTTGYVSYRALPEKLQNLFTNDPFYSRLDCNASLKFIDTDYAELFFSELRRKNIGYIIINNHLIGQPGCEPLVAFIDNYFPDNPNLRMIDADQTRFIFEVAPSTIEGDVN